MGLRAREIWALEALYDVYGRRAYSLAYRIVSDHGAAEDAVQDAFLDLWQHAERLNPSRGTLESLLLTVVHHRAIDRLRKIRGQTRLHGISISRHCKTWRRRKATWHPWRWTAVTCRRR